MNKREKQDYDNFIKEYTSKILEGRASLFIGSGFSREANLPVWSELLKEFAEEIGLDIKKEEHNLITLAQYYVNAKKRKKLNDTIKDRFSYSKITTPIKLPNHDIISVLPIKNIWTTNYDQFLEKTFEQHNITPICLTDDKTIKKINSKDAVIIHKIHGDADNPDECVITKSDYDLYDKNHEMLLAKLKAEMCYNTFLFLGYSFSDTNIQHILSRIRAVYGTDSKIKPNKHYCILAKNPKYKGSEQKYDNQKMKHHIADLKSYGIYTILLDTYDDITILLKAIRDRVLMRNIFISGSYYNPIKEHKIDKNLKNAIDSTVINITRNLIQNSYVIYSGYGLNIGPNLVYGAELGCEETLFNGVNIGHRKNLSTNGKDISWLNDHLKIFPFPYQGVYTPEERRYIYTKWRRNIIEHTQVSIIICGINLENNIETNAKGVEEEAEISLTQGNLVIPIKYTGGAAEKIWERMIKLNTSYTNSDLFQALGNPDNIVDTVRLIIEQYALEH